jgi:acetyl-CoA acetyltransferase
MLEEFDRIEATRQGWSERKGGGDICPGEEAPKWIDEGYLEIDGKKPSSPSSGLVTKGHPIGATGLGQIHEIVLLFPKGGASDFGCVVHS